LLSNQTPEEQLENKHGLSTKNSKEGTSKYFNSFCHLQCTSYHTIPHSECAHLQSHQIVVYGLGGTD